MNNVLNEINRGVNPATGRKISTGRVSKVLKDLKDTLRTDPAAKIWNSKDCPTGAFFAGKCHTSKRDITTVGRFMKTFSSAQHKTRANKLEIETYTRKQNLDDANKRIRALAEENKKLKADLKASEELRMAQSKNLRDTRTEYNAFKKLSKEFMNKLNTKSQKPPVL